MELKAASTLHRDSVIAHQREAAAFARRVRAAAGAALAIHLLCTFALPSKQLPLTSLEPNEAEATQVELVGSIQEAVESPSLPPPPPPAEPVAKTEPVPAPKPDPDPLPLPDPPPKPIQRPPPQPQPALKPAPAAKKTPSPPTAPPASSSPARPGSAPGATPGTSDSKGTRPSYREGPQPKYPAESSAAREHGTVYLIVEISAAGRPDSVKLERSSGFERLDRAAMEAVRRWRFNPAVRDGKPVPARVSLPVRFQLP